MGVDANWELQLPKAANRFNFDTIADVIFTLEYTALHSADYRQQVIQEIDRSFKAERAYSIRKDFPDRIFRTTDDKFQAILETVKEMHDIGRPVSTTHPDTPPHRPARRMIRCSRT